MDWLGRLYLRLRGNGWFAPSATGGLLPFPESWQAWLATGLFMLF